MQSSISHGFLPARPLRIPPFPAILTGRGSASCVLRRGQRNPTKRTPTCSGRLTSAPGPARAESSAGSANTRLDTASSAPRGTGQRLPSWTQTRKRLARMLLFSLGMDTDPHPPSSASKLSRHGGRYGLAGEEAKTPTNQFNQAIFANAPLGSTVATVCRRTTHVRAHA
jgi:hypothetical protein